VTQPSARVIADSITLDGHRLTTMEVVMHRFVLAEFNTHRVFSRNSASSRAIPLTKQMERVHENPASPVIWAGEQKGMQGGEEIARADEAQEEWLAASREMMSRAGQLGFNLHAHKSIANRLLEPFMWHTVVVTATAWENFFKLRCSPLAQPEMKAAAEAMKFAYDVSSPEIIEPGHWHLPFIQDDERDEMPLNVQIMVSAARCARVSYLQQNGERDFEKDVQLYETLTSNGHSSPLEHVATPAKWNNHTVCIENEEVFQDISSAGEFHFAIRVPRYGNLLGWHQHRFDVEASHHYQAFK
jgi:thymidylate synthase ThyX